MKLESEVSVVERSGDFTESSFSIEMNSKAFYVLSAQLYQNKIQAVIRELSTNAHDAQIFSKSKRPIDVSMPSMWQPEFSVRDYGPGLSEEDVQGLYTTYFKSNKIHSNDFVGCLGLGSKSPFAYTDSFTVTSWFDGECKTYTMYLDEQKFPKCALLTTNPTKEPNGLKVSISVKNEDISKFQTEGKRVYSFFKDKPNFVHGKINLVDIKGSIEGKDWKYGITTEFGNTAFAVMGNIAYPIQNAAKQLPAHLQKLCSAPVVIYVGIGDVEPTPSREDLSYNKATIASIRDKLELVSAEFLKTAQKEVEAATTLWDARFKYNELQRNGTFNYVDGKLVTWKGQNVSDLTVRFQDEEFSVTLYRKRGSKISQNTERHVTLDKGYKFFWLDDEKARRNFLHEIKTNSGGGYSWSYGGSYFLVQPGTIVDKKTGVGTPATTTKADFEKLLGRTIDDVSSLPKPPSVQRGPKSKYKMLVADLKAKTVNELSDSITPGEHYLYINRNTDLAPGDKYQSYWKSKGSIFDIVEKWNKLNPKDKIQTRVLLLKHHQDEAKTRKYKLVNVYDKLYKHFEAFVKIGNNKNLLAAHAYFLTSSYNNPIDCSIFQLVTDPKFQQFSNPKLSNIQKELKEYHAVNQEASIINTYFSDLMPAKAKPNLDLDVVIQEYPMLKLVFQRYCGYSSLSVDEQKVVLEHIQ